MVEGHFLPHVNVNILMHFLSNQQRQRGLMEGQEVQFIISTSRIIEYMRLSLCNAQVVMGLCLG